MWLVVLIFVTLLKALSNYTTFWSLWLWIVPDASRPIVDYIILHGLQRINATPNRRRDTMIVCDMSVGSKSGYIHVLRHRYNPYLTECNIPALSYQNRKINRTAFNFVGCGEKHEPTVLASNIPVCQRKLSTRQCHVHPCYLWSALSTSIVKCF